MGERRVDPLFGPDGTAGPTDAVDGLLPGFALPQLDLPVIGADGRVTGLAGGDVDPADVDQVVVAHEVDQGVDHGVEHAVADHADPDPASLPAAGTVAWLVAQRAAAGMPLQSPAAEAPARPGPGAAPAGPVASTAGRAVTVPPPEPSIPDPSRGDASSPGTSRGEPPGAERPDGGRPGGELAGARPGEDESSGSERRRSEAASAQPARGERSGAGLLRRAPRVDPTAPEQRASSGSSTSESVASPGQARSRGRSAEKPTGETPRDRSGAAPAGPSAADASQTEVPVESPRPVVRPVVDRGPTVHGHRPPIEPEPSILGLSRHTRGKLGSRLFTWFFVAVFVAIAIQLIVSLLTY